MGIPGLLVALKSYLSSSAPPQTASLTSFRNSDHPSRSNKNISRNKKDRDHSPYNGNIYSDFHNQAVAIDASSWFHKSVYSIADHYVECIEKNNLTTTGSGSNNTSMQFDAKCIAASKKYMIERCTELLSNPHRNGVSKIYLVMDGERCPLKSITNQERTDKRTKALNMARKYKAQGQTDKMHEQYRSCIKVVNALSFTVAIQIQEHFAALSNDPRVEIVWSPYEADAQLVQLCGIEQRCSAIITEDSDVLVYCAACHVSIPIIYKLDRKSGNCSTLSMDWLIHPTKFRNGRCSTNNNNTQKNALVDTKQSTKISTIDAIFDILVGRQIQHPGWGTRLFVQGCVLAGCDYSPRGQIPGVGLVNAFKYVQMAGLTPIHQQLNTTYDRILKSFLPMKCRRLILDAIPTLEIQLSQSEAVFYYHPVLKLKSSNVVEYLNEMSTIDNETVYQPSLRRYDSDLSFLGSLTMNRLMGDSGIIPSNIVKENNINRKRKSTDHSPKNNSRPTKSILVPFCKSTNNNRGLSDGVSPLSSSTSSFVHPNVVVQNENNQPPMLKQHSGSMPARPVINPYNPKHKSESRPPLQSLNPFEVYARRHREVGIQESNRIVTAKLPVRRSVNALPSRGKNNDEVLLGCPQPLPNITTMASSSVIRKQIGDDVRFVKRTDYGIDIDVDKHTYRPPMRQKDYMAKSTAMGAQHGSSIPQVFDTFAQPLNNCMAQSLPTRSAKTKVKSKFFSDQKRENDSSMNFFEIKEECPPLSPSKLDVVSLINFDQYESPSLLSPDKSPTVFHNSFEYDIPKESPSDDTLLLKPHTVLDIHGDTPHCIGVFRNENDNRPNFSNANRRVTLELSNEESVDSMRPKTSTVPIHFSFYDTVPFQSPIKDIRKVDEKILNCLDTTRQNVTIDEPERTVETLKYRFGSASSVKPLGKKVVKRTGMIQRVLQKYRKRPATRVPTQTSLLSHFHPERRPA